MRACTIRLFVGLGPGPVRTPGMLNGWPSAPVLLALVIFSRSCGHDPDGTIHPTPENIPEIEDPRFVLRHEEEDTLYYANPDGYDKITVGIEEGNARDMIGEIRDMASDGNGTLYVLDKAHSNVRAYDYDGRLIGIFGAAGEGPGEFYNPWNIAVTEGGSTIIVASVSSPRINLFTREGSTFRLRSSFNREGAGFAMCAMNGYIYLIADIPGVDGIIHRYSLDGERKASFGYRYRTHDAAVQQSLSYKGRLACNEEQGVVAWIRDNIPNLTGYSSDGDQMWQVRFADFQPRLVEAGVSGSGAAQMSYHQPEPGQSAYFDLFSDSGNHFYVLYGTFGADGNGRAHMFRIDALTGLGEEVANAGPPMPRLVDGEYFVTYMSSPYVKFTVYRPSKGSS